MKEKITVAFVVFLIMFSINNLAYSELKDTIDSQGNKYRIDMDGTIYTYGDPHAIRQPASIENLPYYYNETLNLISKKHNFEGIIMGSEILDLPEKSVGIRVSKWSVGKVLAPIISESELNQHIVVVKHREDNNIIYRNRRYNFELKYPLYFKIFAELAGLEEGTMANVGFILSNPEQKELPINIIIFAKHLKDSISLNEFSSQWSLDKRPNLKLTPIDKPFGETSKGYQVEWLENGKTHFMGEQIFVIQDKIGYQIMLSCPKDKYDSSLKVFRQFLSDMKIAKIPPLKYIPDDDPAVKKFLEEKTSDKKK